MARYDDRDYDDDRRDRRDGDRHRHGRWRVAGYGNGPQHGRGTDSDDGIDRPPPDRGDYYDPDHEYRARRYQRASDQGQPYANRPYPGEYGERRRPVTRPRAAEEHAWRDPSSWLGEGRHRGVGPKGYVRSDERIREYVCDCLMDDPHLDASGIEVVVKAGDVTLSGTVASRGAKHHAEELIEHVGGVKHVQNNLRVSDDKAATH